MIEALNNYRMAREASEKAATELGRVFGEAFGKAHPQVKLPELGQFNNPAINDMSIDFIRRSLGDLFMGDFGDFIKRENQGTFVGVNLKNSTLAHAEANRVLLDEPYFALGVVEGFKKTRR